MRINDEMNNYLNSNTNNDTNNNLKDKMNQAFVRKLNYIFNLNKFFHNFEIMTDKNSVIKSLTIQSYIRSKRHE